MAGTVFQGGSGLHPAGNHQRLEVGRWCGQCFRQKVGGVELMGSTDGQAWGGREGDRETGVEAGETRGSSHDGPWGGYG